MLKPLIHIVNLTLDSNLTRSHWKKKKLRNQSRLHKSQSITSLTVIPYPRTVQSSCAISLGMSLTSFQSGILRRKLRQESIHTAGSATIINHLTNQSHSLVKCNSHLVKMLKKEIKNFSACFRRNLMKASESIMNILRAE